MVNVIYLISLLIAFLTGFFVAIKAVHIGLKWNIQIADNKEPELHNPIAETVKEHKQQKQAEISKSLFDEWTNGKEG